LVTDDQRIARTPRVRGGIERLADGLAEQRRGIEAMNETTHHDVGSLVNILRHWKAFQDPISPSGGFLRYHGALRQVSHDT
jgi:hypothetical protein